MDHFSTVAPMRPDLVVDVPVELREDDHRPLPVQLCDAVRELVLDGRLRAGDHLPSSRSLARQLGVSRGTVVAAFEQLEAEGYFVARSGSGTRINPHLGRLHRPADGRTTDTDASPTRLPGTFRLPRPTASTVTQGSSAGPSSGWIADLTPGVPDTAGLADPTWRAAWRRACADPRPPADPLGSPRLREEVAEHLRQMRGLVTDPGRVVVTGGARAGLGELMRLWSGPAGARLRVGVESPGYPSLRRVPGHFGHEVIGLRTDGNGLNTDWLPTAGDLDVVLVTPSHQYPWGGSMSADRRADLVHWAETTGCWVVEDDFDSELRHVGSPLPALSVLDPRRTILLGTFSSVLTPAVACGYLVIPPELVAPMSRLRADLGHPVAGIVQQALAGYLSTGALRRRTQRMRQVYRRRRRVVMDILGNVPGTELRPIDGGLHAVLVCSRPEREIVEACRRGGVGIAPLSSYWGHGTGSAQTTTPGAHEEGSGGRGEAGSRAEGVVLGFGAHDDPTLVRALEVVARAAARTTPRESLGQSTSPSNRAVDR